MGTILCDVCEQDTPTDAIYIGIGDSTICKECYEKEQVAWRKVINYLSSMVVKDVVCLAVRNHLIAELRKEHKIN